MSKRVFLIDAHALCYRAFYAVKALKNSKGMPTNAVFGFCQILRKILSDHKPTHIGVCFDVSKKTFRHEKFPEYKIQRQAMPDDLRPQMGLIRDIVSAYGFLIFEKEGYEADDLMATLSRRFAGGDVDVFIVSDDKDMAQIVDKHIQLYNSRQEEVMGIKEIEEKFGVAPSQMVDYLSLIGDASDNVPGVKGIGQKGACKLISQFQSLEGIYEHLDEVSPVSLREKLLAGKNEAILSKELVTLEQKVPLEIDLDDMAFPEPDRHKLFTIFNELEFRKLAQEYQVCHTNETCHSEGTCHSRESGNPVQKNCVTITVDDKPLLIVYDYKSLLKEGFLSVSDNDQVFDIFIADYLLADSATGQYDMPGLRLSEEGLKELYEIQKQLLKEQQLEFLFYEVEMPLSKILFEMESHGVSLEVSVLERLSKECQAKMSQLEEILFELAGSHFNINSPKQLSEILFSRLKLPVVKKNKTGYSTNEEVLTKLSSKHPLPARILEYRQLAKLKSTYLDALPLLVDKTGRLHATFNQVGAQTGRLSSNDPNLQNIPIRTDLGQLIRRAFVPYQEGHVLLSADYSQIELRILALLAQDEALQKACKGQGDVHRYTASLMFEVPEDMVDEKMRYAAKRINFGIIYGMSAYGLAKDLDVPVSQAQDFIDKYFLRYPKVREFLDGEIQKARDLGYVSTLYGRRRYLPDIHNRNLGLRQFAERQAINAPMQGTAADIIKIAMVKISNALATQKLSSTMTMTVHDELVFDVPQAEIKTMVSLVRKEMEGVMGDSNTIPLTVSIKAGPNWLDMQEVDS
ncbi:MAG: DNA polymerase I [Candidatus Omnitrophica bacterium]|nr:DNA polymerase I [Candidatus Omnitrophota bacterium]